MNPILRRVNHGRTGLGLAGIVVLASAVHGCASAEQEGDYVNPPGFSPEHTQAVALSAASFVRNDQNQLLTTTLSAQRVARQEASVALDMRSAATGDRLKLAAEFHGTYADGVTVSSASQPRASVRVVPVAAQKARGRLRNDGAVVAFEDAFPRVTSAFGARDSRLEEFLVVADERDVPTLAYDLIAGPDFDRIEADDDSSTLWAYARDGEGVFTILPPNADDAAGRHVEGSWKLEKRDDGYRITAQLDLHGLQFPVLIDPTFETPNWFKNTTGQPSARLAASGAFDITSKCTVLFGGISNSSTFTANQETSLRCADRNWSANITIAGTKPGVRGYAAMGYSGTSGKVYLFGGRNDTNVLNDLYAFTPVCTTPGVTSTCSGTWTKITPTGTVPAARTMAGMAWTGSKLLMFGGIDGAGAGLRDTWSYNPSTNAWTQECASCFGGSNGLFGFATATLVGTSTRNIYVTGGYNNPTAYGAYYTNSVYHWNGSSWDSSTTGNQVIPEGADSDRGITGITDLSSSAVDLAPQPRYLHWSVGTNNGLMLFGGGLSSTTPAAPASPVNLYYGDSWLWLDSATSGLDDQWLAMPHPRAVTSGPGVRGSATAVYDENLKEAVLFGGLKADESTLVSDGKVYRGVQESFTVLQACTSATCANVNLTTVIKNATAATCGNYEVQYLVKSTSSASWAYRGAAGAGSTASAIPTYGVIPTATSKFLPTAYKTGSYCYVTSVNMGRSQTDYGARVRNNLYHLGGANCAATAGEAASGGSAACLGSVNAYVGTASCGGQLVSAGQTSDSCDNY